MAIKLVPIEIIKNLWLQSCNDAQGCKLGFTTQEDYLCHLLNLYMEDYCQQLRAKVDELEKDADRWISVDKRLPELTIEEDESIAGNWKMPANKRSKECLIVVNGKVTQSRLFWREDYPNDYRWLMIESGVTHWMYLPQPPTEAINKAKEAK